MLAEQKKAEVISKMLLLKENKRLKFREFLVNSFTDDDVRDLSVESADKMLHFLSKL